MSSHDVKTPKGSRSPMVENISPIEKKASKLPNMSLTNQEWTTLNNVVDSLLRGAEIDHIVASAIPKLDFVLNARLQDAITRNYSQTVTKLKYNINRLHKLSEVHGNTSSLENSLAKLSSTDLKKQYINHQKALEDMNNYYETQATKLAEKREKEEYILNKKFEEEQNQLEQEITYSLANIIYSKAIANKRTFIKLLISRNKIQEAEKQKEELQEMESREREEYMFRMNDEIVQKKHDLASRQELERQEFNIKFDDLEDRLERDRRRDVDGERQILAMIAQFNDFDTENIEEEEITEEEDDDLDHNYSAEEEYLSNIPSEQSSQFEISKKPKVAEWIPFIEDPCVPYPY